MTMAYKNNLKINGKSKFKMIFVGVSAPVTMFL